MRRSLKEANEKPVKQNTRHLAGRRCWSDETFSFLLLLSSWKHLKLELAAPPAPTLLLLPPKKSIKNSSWRQIAT